MKNLFYFLFIALLLIPLGSYAFAETWKVQIPSGSSEPTALAHFLPIEISVRFGDTVEWGNADTVTHTVTSGTLESGPTGMFDSGHLAPGDRFTFFFDEQDIGEIKYFCTIHPWMIGVVNVMDLASGFQVFHNVGSDVSDTPIDVEYKVQRNLVDVTVDPVRNMLVFNFAGKINNDTFVVRLPEDLIKDPQSVWINDNQITDYKLTKMNKVASLTIVLGESAQQVKVVGTDVIGKITPKKQVLINQMFGITDKKFYDKFDDEITVSGEIKNPVQIYKISLDIISPKGVIVYHKEVPLVDSKFSETIPTSNVLKELGEYTVKIVGSDAKSLFLPFEYVIIPQKFQPPIKQMNSGIEPGDILCNEGFELLMKKSNGKAVCLTESTAMILLQKGWADYF